MLFQTGSLATNFNVGSLVGEKAAPKMTPFFVQWKPTYITSLQPSMKWTVIVRIIISVNKMVWMVLLMADARCRSTLSSERPCHQTAPKAPLLELICTWVRNTDSSYLSNKVNSWQLGINSTQSTNGNVSVNAEFSRFRAIITLSFSKHARLCNCPLWIVAICIACPLFFRHKASMLGVHSQLSGRIHSWCEFLEFIWPDT